LSENKNQPIILKKELPLINTILAEPPVPTKEKPVGKLNKPKAKPFNKPRKMKLTD